MSVKKYAIIILSILVIAFIISRIPSCKPTVTVVDIEKQSMQKAIDSMHLKMQNLDWENHILVVKLAESKANVQVINKTKEVIIHDTIIKNVGIFERFPENRYTETPSPIPNHSSSIPNHSSPIPNHSSPTTHHQSLLLPTHFNLKDSTGNLSLSGVIDTQGITLQRITITNRIALKDDVKKSFFTEKHSFSVTQSNPYISSVIPVYLYQKPTRRGIFLEKVGCVAIGFGIGYAASEFKIFKK
jgi:hypothetical protein